MLIYKEVEAPARTIKVLESIMCDSCGTESKYPDDWSENAYEFNRIEIAHDVGTAYPEYTSGHKLEIDLCPKCLEEKLIPYLQSIGCKAEYKEYSD